MPYHQQSGATSGDEAFVQATTEHELVHSLKSMGVIDIDVPTAAAAGYYVEWSMRGRLTDASKDKYFEQGMNSTEPDDYVENILNRYRSEWSQETPQSYIASGPLGGTASVRRESGLGGRTAAAFKLKTL